MSKKISVFLLACMFFICAFVTFYTVSKAGAEDVNDRSVPVSRLTLNQGNRGVSYSSFDGLSLTSLSNQVNTSGSSEREKWQVVTLSGFDTDSIGDIAEFNALKIEIEVPIQGKNQGMQIYAEDADGTETQLHRSFDRETNKYWANPAFGSKIGADYGRSFFRYDYLSGIITEVPLRAWLYSGIYLKKDRTVCTAAEAFVQSFSGAYIIPFVNHTADFDWSSLKSLTILLCNTNEPNAVVNIGNISFIDFEMPLLPSADDAGVQMPDAASAILKEQLIWNAAQASMDASENVYTPSLRPEQYSVRKLRAGDMIVTRYESAKKTEVAEDGTEKISFDANFPRTDNFKQVLLKIPEEFCNQEGFVDIATPEVGIGGFALRLKNESENNLEFFTQITDGAGKNFRAAQSFGPIYDNTATENITKTSTGSAVLSQGETYKTVCTNINEIGTAGIVPAGFDGWIYIPFTAAVFSVDSNGAGYFPQSIRPTITMYINLTNVAIEDGEDSAEIACISMRDIAFVPKEEEQEIDLPGTSLDEVRMYSEQLFIENPISEEFTRISYDYYKGNLWVECDLSEYPIQAEGATALLVRAVHTRSTKYSDQPLQIHFIDSNGFTWKIINDTVGVKDCYAVTSYGQCVGLTRRGNSIRSLRDYADMTAIIPMDKLECTAPGVKEMKGSIVKVRICVYPDIADGNVDFAIANFGAMFVDQDKNVSTKVAKDNGVIPSSCWSVSDETTKAKDDNGISLSEYIHIGHLDCYDISYTVNDDAMGSVKISSEYIYRPFNETLTVRIMPREGYEVASVKMNGSALAVPASGGVYSTANVAQDTVFEVTFAAVKQPVEKSGCSGSISFEVAVLAVLVTGTALLIVRRRSRR